MWCLKKLSKTENKCVYILPEKKTFTVGRSGVDLVLKDDASISRSHASFTLEEGVLKIEDCKSKYGTYINNGILQKERITSSVALKPKDRIRFGLLTNVWILSICKVATLISSLNSEDGEELRKVIEQLNGKILANIDKEFTHLTMSQLTVTVKLLYALVYEKPIVSVNYWKDYIAALNTSPQELPDPEQYPPKPTDICRDVKFKEARRTLFKGLTFIFVSSRQFNMYHEIVEKIGGVCKNLSAGVQKSLIIKPNVIVIQYIPTTQSQSSQTISAIGDLLSKQKKRLVPDYEIGLAIIACSVSEFCNPNESVNDGILAKINERKTQTPHQKLETMSVPNSLPEENSQSVDIRDVDDEDDFVVEETDQAHQNSNSQSGSSAQSTLYESKSNLISSTNKRSRAISLSDDEDLQFEELKESESKKPRKETKANDASMNSRTLRSKTKTPPSAKKEIAVVNRSKSERLANQPKAREILKKSPKKAKQKSKANDAMESVEISSSGSSDEASKPPKRVTRKSIIKPKEVAPKKPILQSINLDSSDDEEVLPKPLPTAKNSGSKRKRILESQDIADSDLDEDEELFNFSKKPHTEEPSEDFPLNSSPVASPKLSKNSETLATKKPSPKPLPLIPKTTTAANRKTTINIKDFIDISQRQPLAQSTEKQDTSLNSSKEKSSSSSGKGKETKAEKKKFYIPVIGSDDDDENDDNLFNFIGNDEDDDDDDSHNNKQRKAKNKPTTTGRKGISNLEENEDDDDNLFEFSSSQAANQSKNKNKNSKTQNNDDNDDDDDIDGDDFDSMNTQKINEDFVETQMPKPKPLPSKINVSDWVCCTNLKNKIKKEDRESSPEPVDQANTMAMDDLQDMVDGVQIKAKEETDNETTTGGCLVKFMNLTIKAEANNEEPAASTSSTLNKTGVKNFKAFVKNRHIRHQTTIIPLKGAA